jgi:hypothetical protein
LLYVIAVAVLIPEGAALVAVHAIPFVLVATTAAPDDTPIAKKLEPVHTILLHEVVNGLGVAAIQALEPDGQI